VNTAGGDVTIKADLEGIRAERLQITSGSGGVIINGSFTTESSGEADDFVGVDLIDSSISVTDAAITVVGMVQARLFGGDFAEIGVRLAGSSITAQDGSIDVQGFLNAFFSDGEGPDAPTGGTAGLELLGTEIETSSGTIHLTGKSLASFTSDAGIRIGALESGRRSRLATASGQITLEGDVNPGTLDPIGIHASDTEFVTTSGPITLRGGLATLDVGDGTVPGAGAVLLDEGTVVTRNGADGAGSFLGHSSSSVTVQPNITFTATAGPFNVSFVANNLTVNDGVSITTNGGFVKLVGDSQDGYADSIRLNGTEVSPIMVNTGGGAVTMKAGVDGIVAQRLQLDAQAGRVLLDGQRGGSNLDEGDEVAGVALRAVVVDSSDGDISITGRSTTAAGGVSISDLDGARSRLQPHTGRITLIGRSQGGVGVSIVNTDIGASTGGTIWLAGTSAGADASSFGLLFQNASIGGESTASTIILSPWSPSGSPDILVEEGSVATLGVVNLRPAEVLTDGAIEERTDVPIEIGSNAANGSVIAPELLAIINAGQGLVVGSDAHSGAIRVAAATTMTSGLTLQNTGRSNGTFSTSGGIDISAPIDVGNEQLALVSSGAVKQSAAGGLSAGSLVLRGFGADADFDLSSATNRVRNIAACATGGISRCAGVMGLGEDGRFIPDPVYRGGGSITYKGQAVPSFDPNDKNAGVVAVVLDPLAWTGFSRVGAAPVTETIEHSGSGGPFTVTATGGKLLLDPDVTAYESLLTLAAPDDTFNNFAGGALATGGSGGFRILQRTWDGQERGGINAPSFYNCPSGSCATTQDAFVYVDQPTATVRFDSTVLPFGTPLSSVLGFSSPTGLVNGDSTQTALGLPTFFVAGRTVTPGMLLAPGTYSISAEFHSPTGYRVVQIPGAVTVIGTEPPINGTILDNSPPSEAASLALPGICTSVAPAPVAYSSSNAGDKLDVEWYKTRQRLTLNSCTGLRLLDACSDF
jgi:hypothetical protein